jgi:small-conductance mechanosensitive channel
LPPATIPQNFQFGKDALGWLAGTGWPSFLAATTAILFLVAVTNLLTKQIATVYGVSFSLLLFAAFGISERLAARERRARPREEEEFNLVVQPELDAAAIHARPGCVVVALREYTNMLPLKWAVEKTKRSPSGHCGSDDPSAFHRRR